MPQRAMLNLELGRCYEVSYHSDWLDQYARKVRIIELKNVHSDRIHSYGTTSPEGFSYIWDYGWEKGTSCVFSGNNYSVVGARELKDTELEEFEAKIRASKKLNSLSRRNHEEGIMK